MAPANSDDDDDAGPDMDLHALEEAAEAGLPSLTDDGYPVEQVCFSTCLHQLIHHCPLKQMPSWWTRAES